MTEKYIKVEDAHTLGSPYYGKDTPILEMVRCKDCVYWLEDINHCRDQDRHASADDYCAWGEEVDVVIR